MLEHLEIGPTRPRPVGHITSHEGSPSSAMMAAPLPRNTRRGQHQIVSAMITPIAASIAEIHAGFSAFPTCRKNAYQSIASTAPKLL